MRSPFIWLAAAAGFVFRVGTTNLVANKNLDINVGAIAGDRIPQISTDGTTLTFVDPGALGGGTVTSVSVGANASAILGIANASTTPTITFDAQAINTVFAGPGSGGAAAPTFRALVANDIPSIPATKITSGTLAYARLPVGTVANTVAAGDDARLHTQNTDTGTTATSFQLDSGNTGPRVKNESGAVAIRNAADNSYADLVLRNLVVQGTTTTVNSETVTIADNTIVLNSNASGTPTENAGIEVERGTATNSTLLWNEATDRFVAGLVGATETLALKKKFTFTNTNLVAGKLTLAHGLGEANPGVTIWMADGYAIGADVRSVDANNIEIDFGGSVATGTHTVTLVA